ncbi:MAG: type II toxin-antitoxin system ParD family antitoxin [Candidatus Omnitrophica bacterium]|nr:type II toxin-antitoxin system ParD family antitoxin [Candidatus Omnitrophota bacterium]
MHVSLPEELENMVKERVDSGLYGSASEVVRAALRKFFHISEESDIGPEEAARIREVVEPRLEALRNGKTVTHDFDEACEEINKEVFGG